MPDQPLRPLPRTVRPVGGEGAGSYVRRLAQANHLLDDHVARMLGTGPPSATGHWVPTDLWLTRPGRAHLACMAGTTTRRLAAALPGAADRALLPDGREAASYDSGLDDSAWPGYCLRCSRRRGGAAPSRRWLGPQLYCAAHQLLLTDAAGITLRSGAVRRAQAELSGLWRVFPAAAAESAWKRTLRMFSGWRHPGRDAPGWPALVEQAWQQRRASQDWPTTGWTVRPFQLPEAVMVATALLRHDLATADGYHEARHHWLHFAADLQHIMCRRLNLARDAPLCTRELLAWLAPSPLMSYRGYPEIHQIAAEAGLS